MSKNGSKQLSEFVKSYNSLFNINMELVLKYTTDPKFMPHFIQFNQFGANFEDPYWKNVSVQIRAEIRILLINNLFSIKMIPNINELINVSQLRTKEEFESAVANLKSKKFYHSPNKIVGIIIEVLDNLTEEYLKASYKERTSMDCVLDFLKACTNFLIMLVTFGASQSFFNTTTSRLEKVKEHQDALKSIHSKLTDSEQNIQLVSAPKGLEIEAEPTQLVM